MTENKFDIVRDVLRQHDIYISENEVAKLFDVLSEELKEKQKFATGVICDALDKFLKNPGEKLHAALLLSLFARDNFLDCRKAVVYGSDASVEFTNKLNALEKLIHEILQFLTPSTVFSNVFSKLMHDKEQAYKDKPENLAG